VGLREINIQPEVIGNYLQRKFACFMGLKRGD